MTSNNRPLNTLRAKAIATVVINRHARNNRIQTTGRRFATVTLRKSRTALHLKRRRFTGINIGANIRTVNYRFNVTNGGNVHNAIVRQGHNSVLTRNRLMTNQDPIDNLKRALISLMNRFNTTKRHRRVNSLQRNSQLARNLTNERVRTMINVPALRAIRRRSHNGRAENDKGGRIIIDSNRAKLIQRRLRVNVRLLSFLDLKKKNTVNRRSTVTTRLMVIQAIFRITTMNRTLNTITTILPRNLVSMVPSRTTLMRQMTLRFNMRIRTTNKITRQITMFTKGMQLLTILTRM